jgi:predicted phage tail protein
LIKIIPHGSLSEYPSFSVEANTASEAITAWSMQTDLSKVPAYLKPVVDAVGFPTEDELHKPTEVTEIHLIPRLDGEGAVGKILVGAVFVGLSFVPGLGQIGQVAISTMLFSAGIGLMLSGIMQLFMKAPKVETSEQPDASKILGAPTNTTAIGTIIGRGYGRMRVGGHYLSVQINASNMVRGSFPETIT